MYQRMHESRLKCNEKSNLMRLKRFDYYYYKVSVSVRAGKLKNLHNQVKVIYAIH